MIYVSNKFHISSCSGSLVTAIKREVKENSCMVALLLFYILQQKVPKQKLDFFWRSERVFQYVKTQMVLLKNGTLKNRKNLLYFCSLP
jgi:hypothetical protein